MYAGLLKEVLTKAIGETWQRSKGKIIKAAGVCRKGVVWFLKMVRKYKYNGLNNLLAVH